MMKATQKFEACIGGKIVVIQNGDDITPEQEKEIDGVKKGLVSKSTKKGSKK
jgi:hypothetical protein